MRWIIFGNSKYGKLLVVDVDVMPMVWALRMNSIQVKCDARRLLIKHRLQFIFWLRWNFIWPARELNEIPRTCSPPPPPFSSRFKSICKETCGFHLSLMSYPFSRTYRFVPIQSIHFKFSAVSHLTENWFGRRWNWKSPFFKRFHIKIHQTADPKRMKRNKWPKGADHQMRELKNPWVPLRWNVGGNRNKHHRM